MWGPSLGSVVGRSVFDVTVSLMNATSTVAVGAQTSYILSEGLTDERKPRSHQFSSPCHLSPCRRTYRNVASLLQGRKKWKELTKTETLKK